MLLLFCIVFPVQLLSESKQNESVSAAEQPVEQSPFALRSEVHAQ